MIHQLLAEIFAKFSLFLGFFFNFCSHNSSPPLALCWLIKAECIPLDGEKCHLVVVNGSCYNLSHTFSYAGQYCLSVRVENGVTALQTYHPIRVRPAGEEQLGPAAWASPPVRDTYGLTSLQMRFLESGIHL